MKIHQESTKNPAREAQVAGAYLDLDGDFEVLIRELLSRGRFTNREAYVAVLRALRASPAPLDRDALADAFASASGRDRRLAYRQISTWMHRLDRLIEGSRFRLFQPDRGLWLLRDSSPQRSLLLFEAPSYSSHEILAALKEVDEDMRASRTGVRIVEAGVLLGDKDLYCIVEAEDSASIAAVQLQFLERRLAGRDVRTITYLIPRGMSWRLQHGS